jgi:AcrR family transcriptional regulator
MGKLNLKKKHTHPSPILGDTALPQDTKERLIQVAKCLFAKKGFEGTTVKDISDAAKLNVSLISYHFQGKEGLYEACLETIGKARLAATERILQKPSSLEEFRIRLQMFVEEIISFHLAEPDVSRIINRECEMEKPIALSVFKDTFLRSFEKMIAFFQSAQNQGFLKKELNIEIISSLFFTGIVQLIQKDQLNELFFGRTIKDAKYRNCVIQNAVSFCLFGTANPQTTGERKAE